MEKKVIAIIIILSLLITLFTGCLEDEGVKNRKPKIEITLPDDGDMVTKIVQISGIASDPDGDNSLKKIEVMVEDDKWEEAEGTDLWIYEWTTYQLEEGYYTIKARAWDGADYSDIDEIRVNVFNPEISASGEHKWAVFIFAGNFPLENESKLGNGGLYLAEEMATHFIEHYKYPTSNIVILFDDGWIRSDNGFGKRVKTLTQRYHKYDISYASATKEKVISTIQNVIEQSNTYEDSEVFIWLAGHGFGNSENTITGDKLFESSSVYLWDEELIEDKELGVLLSNMKSKKTCIIVDSCFSGGFADKTIYNFPTLFLLKSGIPQSGRVVITGASKYRSGYSSTEEGPLFSFLWFDGIMQEKADGFRDGMFNRGRPSRLNIFKDGKSSVEEAFYYARYVLRSNEVIKDYRDSQPQINDQYPGKGIVRSSSPLILGQ